MFKLIDSEVWHVVFAAAGAALGWWLRTRQTPGVPAEVASLVEALLAKRKQQQTQTQIDELLSSLRQTNEGEPR